MKLLRYILFFGVFVAHQNIKPSTISTTQAFDIVEIVQYALAQSTSLKGSFVVTPSAIKLTGSQLGATSPFNGTSPMMTVTPQVSMLNTPINPAMSVKGGLKFINVGLTTANKNKWLVFEFDNSVISQLPAALLKAGLYISIGLAQVNGQQQVTVYLTDVNAVVYAVGTQTIAEGVVYANIGFNKNDTGNPIVGAQTYVQWVPIANGQPIVYKQRKHTTSPYVVPAGALPGAAPVQITQAAIQLAGSNQLNLNGTFTLGENPIETSTMLAPFNNPINLQPVSTQGGLQLVSVGLTTAGRDKWVAYNFDNTVMSQLPLSLIQNGLYIVVNLTQEASLNGNQRADVLLCDINGNVYASGTQYVESGVVFANFGFNTVNSLGTLQANQTAVNWVPILAGRPVVYKQSTITTPVYNGQSTVTPSYSLLNSAKDYAVFASYLPVLRQLAVETALPAPKYMDVVFSGTNLVAVGNHPGMDCVAWPTAANWNNGVKVVFLAFDSNNNFVSNLSSGSTTSLYAFMFDATTKASLGSAPVNLSALQALWGSGASWDHENSLVVTVDSGICEQPTQYPVTITVTANSKNSFMDYSFSNFADFNTVVTSSGYPQFDSVNIFVDMWNPDVNGDANALPAFINLANCSLFSNPWQNNNPLTASAPLAQLQPYFTTYNWFINSSLIVNFILLQFDDNGNYITQLPQNINPNNTSSYNLRLYLFEETTGNALMNNNPTQNPHATFPGINVNASNPLSASLYALGYSAGGGPISPQAVQYPTIIGVNLYAN